MSRFECVSGFSVYPVEIRSVNNLSSSEDCMLDRLLSTSMKTAMAETTMLTINYLQQSIKLNVLTSETRRKNSD